MQFYYFYCSVKCNNVCLYAVAFALSTDFSCQLNKHLVGLLGWGISRWKGLYVHRTAQHKDADTHPCLEWDWNPVFELTPRSHRGRDVDIILSFCHSFTNFIQLFSFPNLLKRYAGQVCFLLFGCFCFAAELRI
jgi:hypothetical protein